MSVRFLTVVVDCADPRTLSHRWAEATGYRRSADRDEWASIVGEGDRHIRIGFKKTESKVVKNRVHADLGTPDIEVEAQRLEGFGATRWWISDDPDDLFIVRADPEDNGSCILLVAPTS